MFKRSFSTKDRSVGSFKATKAPKRSYRDDTKRRILETMEQEHHPYHGRVRQPYNATSPMGSPGLTSAIVTLVVGPEQRLFAAHEDVLSQAPFFAAGLRDQFLEPAGKRIHLPDEEPEVLSCVLEYLYKGDYTPRLLHDKRRNVWSLEGASTSPLIGMDAAAASSSTPPSSSSPRSTSSSSFSHRPVHAPPPPPSIFLAGVGGHILRDTAVYCAAERYGLDELKRLALRKQGLQQGVDVGTVLRSARYAYAYTPDSDSRLRAHYLALIIRSRRTFKRSGTMQMEMEMGGKIFFDLFVAMCNHIDDLSANLQRSP